MTYATDILGRAPKVKPAPEPSISYPSFDDLTAMLSGKYISRRTYARSDNGLVAMETGRADRRNVKL